jgi:hypothetical protein
MPTERPDSSSADLLGIIQGNVRESHLAYCFAEAENRPSFRTRAKKFFHAHFLFAVQEYGRRRILLAIIAAGAVKNKLTRKKDYVDRAVNKITDGVRLECNRLLVRSLRSGFFRLSSAN